MFDFMFLGLVGLSFGLLAASGVFTVLLAVGLLPRYAGRTHEAKHILLFESMVIGGTVAGSLATFLVEYAEKALYPVGPVIQGLYGFFAGIFLGTLALAIAEMLDAFPVFFRRMRIEGYTKWIILGIALGKVAGVFIYFNFQLYQTAVGQ